MAKRHRLEHTPKPIKPVFLNDPNSVELVSSVALNAFKEAVEEQLYIFFNVGQSHYSKAHDEALASIQTATADLLESLTPTAYPDPQGGKTEWQMWGEHYVTEMQKTTQELMEGK